MSGIKKRVAKFVMLNSFAAPTSERIRSFLNREQGQANIIEKLERQNVELGKSKRKTEKELEKLKALNRRSKETAEGFQRQLDASILECAALRQELRASAKRRKKFQERLTASAIVRQEAREKIKELTVEITDAQSAKQYLIDLISGTPVEISVLRLMRRGAKGEGRLEARALAHRLYDTEATRVVGGLAIGTFLTAEHMSAAAIKYFQEAGIPEAERYCLVDYLTALITVDEEEGLRAIRSHLGKHGEVSDPGLYLGMIKLLIKHRYYEDARKHFPSLLNAEANNPKLENIDKEDLIWIKDRLSAYHEMLPAGGDKAINVAVMDYKLLDRQKTSSNRGDYVQTLASLSNLLRFTNAEFIGEGELPKFLNELKDDVRVERRINSPKVEVLPVVLDRDFASGRRYLPDTWLICNGWFMHRNYVGKIDFPFPDEINPIFISFHLQDPDVLTNEVAAQLKRFEPIGCRDWTTVYRLREFDISCFFSGCLTTTIGQIMPTPFDLGGKKIASVESNINRVDYPGYEIDTFSQVGDYVRDFTLVEGLTDALKMLHGYLPYSVIQTSRLHCYLPCRSMGLPVNFRPRNRSDIRFEGLLHLDEEDFKTMRHALEEKLEQLLRLILDGKTRDEVMTEWRIMCDNDIKFADKYCDTYARPEPYSSLVQDTIATAPRLDGTQTLKSPERVDVAVALDENLIDQLPVLLQSITEHTTSTIAAHIISRGLTDDYGDHINSI